LVEGRDASGKIFQENTVLFYISHHGASFNLHNPIILGAKLKLIIDLPPSLSEDKSLKLVINGKVALVEANQSHPAKQRVSLRFENKYFIKEDG
ncbi:MAG: PilZ domain-containing protein, partial [Acidobacteriota bacterium]